jgi:hypothetical protein
LGATQLADGARGRISPTELSASYRLVCHPIHRIQRIGSYRYFPSFIRFQPAFEPQKNFSTFARDERRRRHAKERRGQFFLMCHSLMKTKVSKAWNVMERGLLTTVGPASGELFWPEKVTC